MPKFKNALLLKSVHRQLTTQGATNPQSVNTATSGRYIRANATQWSMPVLELTFLKLHTHTHQSLIYKNYLTNYIYTHIYDLEGKDNL